MATYLTGSGTLSISDINGLFGRGNDLGSYRGTTYYTSTSGPNTFPASPNAISISHFYGTGPSPNSSGTYNGAEVYVDNMPSASVTVRFVDNGNITCTFNGTVYTDTLSSTGWYVPNVANIGSSAVWRLRRTSGNDSATRSWFAANAYRTIPTTSFDAWYSLAGGPTQNFIVVSAGAPTYTALEIQISMDSGSTVFYTGTVGLSVEGFDL